MSPTSIHALAMAVMQLDKDAARWTELDATEVSEVTDEHLRDMRVHADALRASAVAVVERVDELVAARARAKEGGQ